MKDELKLGIAKIDITPIGKIKVEGYLIETFSNTVRDPLFAKAMVLEQGNVKIAIICCDLLHLGKDFIEKVIKEVEKKTNILQNNIMVCCSHTHSGPQVEDNPLVRKEEKYLEFLLPKLVNVIADANINLVSVKVCITKGKYENLTYWNSRFKFDDGTISWRSPLDDEKATPTGPIDPEVGIIYFKDYNQNKIIATLYNFSCHANAGDYSEISADYPGFASKIIEDKLGGLAFYTRGSAGNIHPRKQGGGVAEELGSKLGNEVLRQSEKVACNYSEGLKSVKEEIVLPIRELDLGQIKEINYICDKSFLKPNFEPDKDESETYKDYFKKSFRFFKELREKTDKISTILQVIRIGSSVLVCIPGEQFVEYGLEIKKKSNFKNTFLINLANDNIGYIPTRKAYKEGGYQTWIGPCIIAPEAGEIIVEKTLNLIKEVLR